MNLSEIFEIALAILASLGGGAVLILAFSSWFGKIWADRILATQKHELGAALEKTKRELDVVKETTLRFQNDKILTYRSVIDIISRLLASLDAYDLGALGQKEFETRFHEFNEQRMRVYGYLAMIAPQKVMTARDKLMGQLLPISMGKKPYEWELLRPLIINLLNEIRIDIGIDKNPIEYTGEG